MTKIIVDPSRIAHAAAETIEERCCFDEGGIDTDRAARIIEKAIKVWNDQNVIAADPSNKILDSKSNQE